MKKQKTIYHLIVDKSGSMADVTLQTITGYNEQVQQIQSVQRDFPEQLITIGLTTFNGNVEHYYFGVPAGNASWLNNQNYVPDGSTSLYDAIGSSVQRLEQQQAMDMKDFDTTVVVIILTDGYENSSRNFRLVDIKRMIARLEETGKWTFSFIGATLDAVEVAAQMDIKAQNSFAFTKETMKEEVWDRVNHSVRTYANKRRKGENLDDLYQ
jgi:von Willebrand factor type A domain